jgi:uncharacterized phage protein gp47/JayE
VVTRDYDDILSDMKNHMIAGQSKITDFNEGSAIMTLFESIARPVETAYIDTRNGYTNILRAIAYNVFDFSKKEGAKATVSVIFSAAEAVTKTVTIPVNTRISNGSLVFITNASAVIETGETASASVTAQAEKIGLEYNVLPGTLTKIESSVPAEVVAVNNAGKATGGADGETESEMLSRFKEYINGLQGSNEYGLRAGVTALEGVRSVGIKEHFPPKNNVYNFTVYVDDGTGKMTDSLKQEVRTVIDGDDSSLNPGKKACGINVDIQPANIVDINLEVTCTIYRTENEVAMNDIRTSLEELVNGKKIGENIVLTDIVLKLRRLSYVTDVNELLINGEAKNVEIDEDSIARLNDIVVTLRSD